MSIGITRRQAIEAGIVAAIGSLGTLSSTALAEEPAREAGADAQPVEGAPTHTYAEIGPCAYDYPVAWERTQSESGSTTLKHGTSSIIVQQVDMDPPTSAAVAQQAVNFMSGAYYQGSNSSGSHSIAWLNYTETQTEALDMGGVPLGDGQIVSILAHMSWKEGCGLVCLVGIADQADFWYVFDSVREIAATVRPIGDPAATPDAGPEPAEPEPTMGQTNALNMAHDYLSVMPFSYNGLIEQLEYSGFVHDEAVYAADRCGADWNQQAAETAQDYLDVMAFSKDGLIEQLEYSGFTHDEAVYGATAVGY